ncbi:hypothetical protein [Bacillus sp. FJAT-42315]|uniref:hypothetical protein n=1 Tax=Bacillus sp. FJAT-42315 TaxID=2014077 RepID=UPI000C23AF83|nr:hypothetical protein [Bacillus sp. FJAT-42315]
MNDSESMLTYRKEEHGSPLVVGACSWTNKEKRSQLFRHDKQNASRLQLKHRNAVKVFNL